MARKKSFNPPLVPTAAEIFTDREAPRKVLGDFFDGLHGSPVVPSRPVKVFYGVGGAGKSALRAKAVDECRTRMSDQGGYPLAFAHVDLDSDSVTPAYPIFDLFAGRLRAALKAAGCPLPLFDVYCLAWHARGMGSGTFSAEQVQDFLGTHQKASEVAGSWWAPLTDFATSLKGVDLVLKAGIAFRTAWHTRRYAAHFPGLELTELSEADFMQNAHHVLAHDLLAFLDAQRERNGHPKALCITIDGLERIQSQVCAHDAQWALQELCSGIATADPQPRCGFVLFGRNRLQWRELYDRRDDLPEDTWDALLEQHLVGGLGEPDAEYFLDQANAWYTARPADPRSVEMLKILGKNRKAILDAAEELADDQLARSFHPYSLDLALRQIDSQGSDFNAAKHLGRGDKELQARFLRYMDETQRIAMQALALALSFDQTLFHLLVEKHHIKGIPVQGFHNLVDPANSHILPAGPQGYRFHSKMQEALLAHLHDQPTGPKQAADVIASLVAHYSAQLAEAVRRQDSTAMQAAYVRGTNILLAHAETGLLDVALFGPAFAALDEAIPGGLLARPRLATWRRAEGVFRARLLVDAGETLNARGKIAYWTGESGDAGMALALFEALLPDRLRVLGPQHPDTRATRNNLAALTGASGDARTALALSEALLSDQQCVLGTDHPDTLTTRANLAHWTGQSGDAGKALALSVALLPDQQRVLGPDHPDTLTTRNNIAAWTGQSGDAGTALALFELLLPDQQRVLGPDHPDTLTTRNNLAHWTGQSGDAGTALALFEALLPDRLRVLGPDHPDTLRTRNNIAALTGESGDAGTALALFELLLPDQQRVLGPDHPDTLIMRNNLAHWTGQSGDAGKALALSVALLPDQQRVLGPDHPDTLTTRNNIAAWTGQSGDAGTALALSEALLPDLQRVLGPDHPDTLTTRNNIAAWTGESGDAGTALALFEALLPDRLRVLGPDHPDTLTTRNNIAAWTGRSGDAGTARALFEALLPDQQRVLGPDHPDTLTTRNNIAAWTGRSGDAGTALALFEALLSDRLRVLGPDHPDTLRTRNNIAAWTGQSGDARTALALYEALLPDQQRVLGPDHPDTLIMRNDIAHWTGESDDAGTARALFEALLPDQQRVLGPDHPDTLTTRANIARWSGESGDAGTALALSEALLLDQQRVLGSDHPDTRATAAWIAHLQQRLRPAPQATANPPGQTPSPARNAPCPCGSGKRFKHCHGQRG